MNDDVMGMGMYHLTPVPPWAFHGGYGGEEVTVGQCLEDRCNNAFRGMPMPMSPTRSTSAPVHEMPHNVHAHHQSYLQHNVQPSQGHGYNHRHGHRQSHGQHLQVPASSSTRPRSNSSGSYSLDSFLSRSASAPVKQPGNVNAGNLQAMTPSRNTSHGSHPYHGSLSDDEPEDQAYIDNSPSERSWSIPSPMRAKNVVYLLFSSPLIISESDPRPVPQIKIRAEVELIIGALQESGSSVEVRVAVATAQNLCQILASRSKFLHLSAHSLNGPEGIGLLLEDGQGAGHVIRQAELERLLRTGSTGNLSCVLINACQSEGVGSLFVDAGVPHVLCCRGKVLDAASRLFTKTFYMCLGSGRSLRQSWDSAREAVRLAPRMQLQQHAEDFVMFGQARAAVTLGGLLAHSPQPTKMKPHPPGPLTPLPMSVAMVSWQNASRNKASYWEDGQTSCATFDLLPARVEDYIGRGVDMAKVLRCFCHDDVTSISAGRRCVNIHGPAGMGKTAFVLETGYYASLPGRIFSRMAAYCVVPDICDDWSDFILDAIHPLLTPLTSDRHPHHFSLVRNCSPLSHDGQESMVGSDFGGISAVSAMSPHSNRPTSASSRLLQSLLLLEKLGRRSLLILDTEDGIPLPEDLCTLLGTLLDRTNTFCVLCACREPLYTSFGQKKLVNVPLEPLAPVDAARLFLRRTHRGLYPHDVDKNLPDDTESSRERPLDEFAAMRHLQTHPLMTHLGGHPEVFSIKHFLFPILNKP